jgi:hypothetical protein
MKRELENTLLKSGLTGAQLMVSAAALTERCAKSD